MGTVSVMSMTMATKLGSLIETEMASARLVAQAAEAPVQEPAGTCPNSWTLIADTQTKKNGQSVDANGDGKICRFEIPGRGNGNTNANNNVKDNNGPPAE